MKKVVCALTLLLVVTLSAFTQNAGPLRGKYSETSSTAQVGDEQRKYWLYNLLPSRTLWPNFANTWKIGTSYLIAAMAGPFIGMEWKNGILTPNLLLVLKQ
jgi:hypothetical protein